jgi:quercetin dioxygenase-like cupin family protein
MDRPQGETITERDARDVILLVAREETSMTWSRYGPGEQGPDPHVHREHTDSFYVLSGELAFQLGPELEQTIVPAGGFVSVPPNLIHAFANEGEAEAVFINVHTPHGGFAEFMRGRRDGRDVGFDSFDPPADGGSPASAATVVRPG